jgi:hypothetical protein
MDDVHCPDPTATMRDAVMAIEAEIIKEEAEQKGAERDGQGLELERLHRRQDAERDKSGKTVYRIAQYPREYPGEGILRRHLAASAKHLDRGKLHAQQQEEKQRRIEADIAVDHLIYSHRVPLTAIINRPTNHEPSAEVR